MAKYLWAQNTLKFDRAVKKAQAEGKGDDEDVIKEKYIELGGKVIEIKKKTKND